MGGSSSGKGLYLGEINNSQREGWIRSIEIFDEDADETKTGSTG